VRTALSLKKKGLCLVPLASLRLARVLTGLYSAFANPVLERFGYGMANMRLVSPDAGR
jgi:hypothetical protein